MLKTVFSVFIVLVDFKSLCIARKTECGYKQCPQTRDGALNVHLIPHSHMDAGWVKTFDEYYYGTRTTISTANVQMIFHSVLAELLHDRRRKFTFSETAYFWRWWKEQRPHTRATFRTLVQEGRIEFAGGGWVQNDEATLHYLQIIDHFTWGLRKLNDTLGPCAKPKASWQIDTYGHSREQTSLLAQMGYDGLFIGRVDHAERAAMIEEDRMEFMWRGSDVLGKMSDIMTHSLYNLYNAPEGFCFDFLCSDEPIVDDPDSKSYNVEKKVNDFLIQIERQAKYYDHDNIMVTMGGDFTYQSAGNWYMNLDKLISHVNSHSGNISDVNIFYSSPSCYLKAIYLYGRRDKAVFTEKNDYFPYGSDPTTYWTGYYTSRPALKYYIRKAHVFLQVVKQLTVIARMGDSQELHLLRHAANLVLHHDAITGTSQQHVTNDYVRMLSEAIDACTNKVSNLLGYLTPTWGGTRRSKNSQLFVACHELNMSQCSFMENQGSIVLIVYNPSSVKTYHYVRLPAVALHYSIRDYNDDEMDYELLPLPTAVINLPGRTSSVTQELYFEAENIPPLGYNSYHISPIRDTLEETRQKRKPKQRSSDTDKELVNTISNDYLKVGVNKDTGLLEYVQHMDGAKILLSQNFHYYRQVQHQQNQQSGAYSLRPENARPTPVSSNATYSVVRGTMVKEIRQRFTDWVTQIIRLYRGEEFIELEWIIGPVPIGADLGKEVVSTFTTNMTTNGVFYTDSNARQMIRRTCWNESATRPHKKLISACYYPVTSRICLVARNSSVSLCVLTDRAQGGASYNDGEIELMVHRRLLTDDGFGLEESLNEEEHGVGLVVRGKHRIMFGNARHSVDDLTFEERVSGAARRWYMEPWLFMTAGDKVSRRKWQHVRNKRHSILRVHGLPRHVQVLTLEPWKGGTVLLRLENTLEKPNRGRFKNEKSDGPEDFANKESHISVNLRRLFNQLRIRRVRETTLAANQWLDDARQMDWSSRYVYQGADDDILPEDVMEYRDDSKGGDDKEFRGRGSSYSDEEPHHKRRRPMHSSTDTNRARERIQRRRYDESYRRRRAVNMSVNIFENTTSDSFYDKFTEKISTGEIESTIPTFEMTEEFDNSHTIDRRGDFLTFEYIPTIQEHTTISHIPSAAWLKPKNVKSIDKMVLTPRKNWKNVPRQQTPSKVIDRSNVEIATTSAEEYPGNLEQRKVKSRRNQEKKRNDPGKSKDDDDDGITKSMYDMYYKPAHAPTRASISTGRWAGRIRARLTYDDDLGRSSIEVSPEDRYERERYDSDERDADGYKVKNRQRWKNRRDDEIRDNIDEDSYTEKKYKENYEDFLRDYEDTDQQTNRYHKNTEKDYKNIHKQKEIDNKNRKYHRNRNKQLKIDYKNKDEQAQRDNKHTDKRTQSDYKDITKKIETHFADKEKKTQRDHIDKGKQTQRYNKDMDKQTQKDYKDTNNKAQIDSKDRSKQTQKDHKDKRKQPQKEHTYKATQTQKDHMDKSKQTQKDYKDTDNQTQGDYIYEQIQKYFTDRDKQIQRDHTIKGKQTQIDHMDSGEQTQKDYKDTDKQTQGDSIDEKIQRYFTDRDKLAQKVNTAKDKQTKKDYKNTNKQTGEDYMDEQILSYFTDINKQTQKRPKDKSKLTQKDYTESFFQTRTKENAKNKHKAEPETEIYKEFEYISKKILNTFENEKESKQKHVRPQNLHTLENKEKAKQINARLENLSFFENAEEYDQKNVYKKEDSKTVKGRGGSALFKDKKKLRTYQRMDVPFFITDTETMVDTKTATTIPTSPITTSEQATTNFSVTILPSPERPKVDFDVDIDAGVESYDHVPQEDGGQDDQDYEPSFRRRKREALAGEDPPDTSQAEGPDVQLEPDYIITLRPTQIRTFIITFESKVTTK